ncbi:TPA: anaerobic ribonucleoside-triphosphate reductase [Klebsiella pneumoniae]|nr:anaerobic ribonucleoside-triphosphate reductase [Klebsiella pneumoniae]
MHYPYKIIKRDGRTEQFDERKVYNAVYQAALANSSLSITAELVAHQVTEYIIKNLNENKSVSNVQKMIEDFLMSNPKTYDIARTYIEYRHDRDKIREGNGKLYNDISGFLEQTAEEFTRENANKPSNVVNTHRDLLAGILSKHVALTQILPKNLSEWHTSGFGHIHDLDYLISPLTNCCLVNYQDMLENGFHIGNAFIEKPKSIGVATTVLTQIIQAVASSQYGGQTCAHIDTGLKQYVESTYYRNEGLFNQYNISEYKVDAFRKTEQDVYDAMQTLIYQVNTLMSVNGQSPFITISLGLDTSEFGRMITRNYLKIHKEGLGKDKVTPVFPKVIFFLEEGVNMHPGDPNYDLKQVAMECCAERIYPDFISVPRNKLVTKSSKGHVTSMGCRSFLSYFATEQGEKYDGRFNLGVVSLNLPMIAKDSVSSGKLFLEELYKHMQTAYEAHMLRINRLKGTKAKQNPVMFVEGALARLDPEETIDKLFYKGYASASFGYVGLYEAIQILYPNCSLEEYKAYGKKILNLMSEMAEAYKKKTGIGFGIYGTPAESLCYKFASKINAKFPGTIKREYLTNSFHVPVDQQVDPFTKWDVESGFDFISSGGNIGYVETPNLKNNMKGLEALIDYGYENIHYFGINQPVDKCLKCGFHGEFKATAEGFECPDCGNMEEGTINVIRRVSGYLSAPNSRPFNKGKMQEVVQRVKHIEDK